MGLHLVLLYLIDLVYFILIYLIDCVDFGGLETGSLTVSCQTEGVCCIYMVFLAY